WNAVIEMVRHGLQARTSREGLVAGPRQRRDARRVISHELHPAIVQSINDLGVEAVHALRPVDRNDRNHAIALVGDRGALVHDFLPARMPVVATPAALNAVISSGE